MARRLLSTAVPLISRRPNPLTSITSIHHRTFALNTSGTESATPSKTGQSSAGGANNQAAGSSTGINANKTGQKQTSSHSTQPAGDADVTKRPATSSPTGGQGLGVGEKSMGSGMAGSYNAQADKQGGKIGQGMGDKHSTEVHKDRAGKGVVPGTGNATSGDETLGGTGNAGSQDANNSMDKASRGSKGSMPGTKTPGGARGFATKAAGGASSNTGNTTSVSGIGSAPTSGSSKSNTSSGSGSGTSTGKSSGSQSSATGASSTGTSSGSGNSTGAKSNLGTASSSGASTTNSTNSAGLGAGPPTPNTASKTGSSSSTTTSKSNTTTGTGSTTAESTSGQGGAINSTGSNRAGSSAGGGAARANTGEHSPSGTAGGVGTGGTTTMESVKEKVKDYTGDVSLPSIPAASSYTVIAAVLLGVPLLFVLDPDRNYLKKQYQENQQRLKEEYH